MLQRDVAKRWNVSEDTVTNWENNRSIPMIKYYPRIAQFLGYEWWKFDVNALAGALQDYRYRNGLSAKQFGKLVGVDGSTVREWEEQRSVPQPKTRESLEALLETIKAP